MMDKFFVSLVGLFFQLWLILVLSRCHHNLAKSIFEISRID